MGPRAPRSGSESFASGALAVANQDYTVFSWRSSGPPVVRTLALTLTPGTLPAGALTNNFSLVWHVRCGVEAVSVDYLIDALGTQQITFPCDAVDVSLRAKKLSSGNNFSSPNFPLKATACIADGSVDGFCATYTEAFYVLAGAEQNMPVPAGARGWRVAGPALVGAPTGSPFGALVNYAFDSYTGAEYWSGFSLESLHQSAGFMPLIANSLGGLNVNNNSASPVSGQIIWALDL